jgi:N6-L-threonylcarbamoyladenine synthase
MPDNEKYILGIESSCDDTAIALVSQDGVVAAAVTQSQTRIHAEWGGVFPELASRAHAAEIIPTIRQTMADANTTPADIRAIAVTRGAGIDWPTHGWGQLGLRTWHGLGQASHWGQPLTRPS